jgi:ankyrin repeat protein
MKLGEHLRYASARGDETKVSLLLSMPGAQSFINYQDGEQGAAPLHAAADQGHQNVMDLLIAARCAVDLVTNEGTRHFTTQPLEHTMPSRRSSVTMVSDQKFGAQGNLLRLALTPHLAWVCLYTT